MLSVIILQDRTIKFYINGQNVRTAKTAIPASKFPVDWEIASADKTGYLRGMRWGMSTRVDKGEGNGSGKGRQDRGLRHVYGRLGEARPSPIPSPCTQFTRARIEWRRCHRAACMARSYQEHHRSVRAEL